MTRPLPALAVLLALAPPAALAGETVCWFENGVVVVPADVLGVAGVGLDLRTGALPTPVAGVIGADLLRPYVLDVSFSPCRVRISAKGRAPAFG
ncbi:MAG TPA: hypothetical protein VHN73_08380, partial [Phenylobacterium sp.]|nr:hypothetical protein [Phenylobacterium sp.]